MKDLALRIVRYIKIFYLFKKINFAERVAFRFGFFLMSGAVFIQLFFNLFFIKIIFGWVENIRGWNFYETLLVVGTTLLLDGLMWVSFAFMYVLRQHIRMGTLDGIITKPLDTQFLISVYRGDLEDILRVLTGVGIIIFSLFNLEISGWNFIHNIFWYLILVSNGFIIIYSLAVMVTSISFWSIESGGFSVIDNVVRMSQYPTDIFSGKIIHSVFSFVLPLAFISTVPSRVLVHGFEWKIVLQSFLVAGVFFLISRKIWYFGLSKYSSASS